MTLFPLSCLFHCRRGGVAEVFAWFSLSWFGLFGRRQVSLQSSSCLDHLVICPNELVLWKFKLHQYQWGGRATNLKCASL
jgi:hypothetical protein